MPNNFVVFCEARTGSYSLVSRLNSLDDVVCHGEVFKKDYIEISNFHKKKIPVSTVSDRNSDPIVFISALRAVNPKKHFGFKLFNHHLNWAPKTVDYLVGADTKRIILCRDPIEVYSSGLRAQKTGVWTLKEGSEHGPSESTPKVEYTEETFHSFCQHYNRFIVNAKIISNIKDSFVIMYDQINDEGAIGALLDFIGSEERASCSLTEYKKQYTGRLEDSFENWEDMASRMEESPFVTNPAASYNTAG